MLGVAMSCAVSFDEQCDLRTVLDAKNRFNVSVSAVCLLMGDAYPELIERQTMASSVVHSGRGGFSLRLGSRYATAR